MKKITFTLILLITLFSSSTRPANAIFGIGDITFDPANLVQALVDYAQQGLQYVQQKMTSAATMTTGAQTTLNTVNNTVLIPARDTLTMVAMMKSGQMMQNMVLGNLGVDPLLVRNPEKWVQGKTEEVVRGVVEDPQVKKAIYDASIMKSVIDQAKYESSDIQTKVRNINQSNIPLSEQKRICDTDETLRQQAIKDLTGLGEKFTQEEVTARAKAIRDSAVCGNIEDPNTKAAVLAVANTNREVNWDTWLSRTVGQDNNFTKEIKTAKAVEERKAQVAAQEQADLAAGKGIRSEKKCVKYQKENDTTSPCLEYKIAKTGDVLNSSFKDSLSNPLKLQLAGFGKGAGNLVSSAVGFAGSAFTTIALLDSMGKDLGVSGGGSSGNQTTNNTTVTTTSAPVNDLVGNQKAKDSVTSAPLEQLQNHKDSLIKLTTTDSNYLIVIDSEKALLDGIPDCFAKVVETYSENFPNVRNDHRIIAAQNFYSERTSINRNLYTKISTEKNSIARGVQLIDTIITNINNSQSTEAILNEFLGYQSKLKEQNIPDFTTSIQREGEYTTYQQNLDQEVKENGANGISTGVTIYTQKKNCSDLEQEMRQKELMRNYYGN